MPLNAQLTERGARLVRTAETAPAYRLFSLPGTQPPKPALLRVAPHAGSRIAVEVWELPVAQYGSFVELVAPPLAIGTLRLADGAQVQGFLCEALATEGAEDLSAHGGWRSSLAARSPAAP